MVTDSLMLLIGRVSAILPFLPLPRGQRSLHHILRPQELVRCGLNDGFIEKSSGGE
ncbi:hypothetical protein ASPCADRAFT_206297 [Aspergillus carbonarius ITEM 5010]|uniref:Uncharacterized protein n=1 Tax=Aspergillus carbonarius (strain ITEM 5010) TaxID=602072 RepID=A0A1R3RSL7_ASPC5|nr:hypothetical protein ASPCADRAFT_206297 [Aspergillus carbonarius ITEM 5010]